MPIRLDHITVTAPSLQAGGEWVRRQLGVQPSQGGQHLRMGTHNLLLRLGEAVFLEVIAIDPGVPAPPRPRWFALDASPADAEPRLACWVARTDDLDASLAQACREPLGTAEPISRGDLRWRISIPADGSLPLGGAAPTLIQWSVPSHPAARMPDQGCRLVGLELLHPQPGRVDALLAGLRLADPTVSLPVKKAAAPGLIAHIQTPRGIRTLGSPPP